MVCALSNGEEGGYLPGCGGDGPQDQEELAEDEDAEVVEAAGLPIPVAVEGDPLARSSHPKGETVFHSSLSR